MYLKTSRKLLANKFRSVAKSLCFNIAIENYASCFAKVIDRALDVSPPNVLVFVFAHLRKCYNYLKGSSMNETPYGIEYTMHQVLEQWFPNNEAQIISGSD